MVHVFNIFFPNLIPSLSLLLMYGDEVFFLQMNVIEVLNKQCWKYDWELHT